MKTLTLSLKKPWFDKIKSGEKKEEYRECSEYWISRFSKLCGKFVLIYAGSHPNCIREHHKDLWRKQAEAMRTYKEVLGERIKDLIDG